MSREEGGREGTMIEMCSKIDYERESAKEGFCGAVWREGRRREGGEEN